MTAASVSGGGENSDGGKQAAAAAGVTAAAATDDNNRSPLSAGHTWFPFPCGGHERTRAHDCTSVWEREVQSVSVGVVATVKERYECRSLL